MKRFLFLIPLAVLGLAACLWVAHRAASRSVSPAIYRPPYDPALAGKMVTWYQKRVQRNPQNGAIENAQLAGAYLARARETGDPADMKRAEQAARRSLAIRSRNNAAARDQLTLALFNQHRFAQAQAMAADTLARYPDDEQALLSYAEASLERGDYDAVQRAIQSQVRHTQSLGLPDPSAQALQARFLEINGQPQAALDLLLKAQAEADANVDMSRQTVAWFHMRVGDILAHMGRADESQSAYESALQIFPQDPKSMTGLARLAAGRQDWPHAIEWGQKAAEVLPSPEALALVGDAYAASGDPQEAKRQYALVDAFSDPSQGVLYDRQRALFCADHGRNLDEALMRARADLAVRHDIYAYDTLAWACYKKGLLLSADAAMKKALSRNTQDALLFYHAGMIANARGDRAQAKAFLTRAVAVNPFFHPFGPAEARKTLAAL